MVRIKYVYLRQEVGNIILFVHVDLMHFHQLGTTQAGNERFCQARKGRISYLFLILSVPARRKHSESVVIDDLAFFGDQIDGRWEVTGVDPFPQKL